MLTSIRRLLIIDLVVAWKTTTILTPLLVFIVIVGFAQHSEALHRQLTKSELIQTFGVQQTEHVPEYRVIRTKRDRHTNGTVKRIRFHAWNSTYVVDLRPNHRLISPHLTSVIRDGNETRRFKGLPLSGGQVGQPEHNCHFQGRVVSHGDLPAAISDCQKLMGVIVADDHFLMLQTLPERMRQASDAQHVIYKREAALINPLEHYVSENHGMNAAVPGGSSPMGVETTLMRFHVSTTFGDGDAIDRFVNASDGSENELEEFCDINNSLQLLNYTLPSEAKLDSLFIFPQLDPITLEIGLFLDSQLYEHFRREFTADPDKHLTDFSLALINNVHVLYQQPTLSPNLEIVIVHFEMWKTQPPHLATELHKNGQAQTLLESFCRHQARINPGSDLTDPGHWDHGVLLTGYDIYHTTSSVAGVAPVGRMCDELFACSLVEGLHLGRSFVLAHEMGHNMGMVHDGMQNQCGRSCCLMSAVNGAGKTTWSTCSVREFNAFLVQLDESGRGNCLRDPAESIISHDHLRDGRLPGQRFTADQQCSYFWGRDYQVEIPNGRQYEDICRILWCGNSGSTISTAHPALEGSWCGGTNWCHEGKCEPWSRAYDGAVPRLIDGGWSDWTSAEKQCPVMQCQITGSISLKSQLRTCTNPAPNNGGKSCHGANVRGVVCGDAAKSTCTAFERQEFGDRLCTSIRNDPSRPDRQLSGASFLHATQPCKIWCHVRDSELIRNKGQFPNGSPCGVDQYCVSGTCLSLSCHGRAVVSSDDDCPSASEAQRATGGGTAGGGDKGAVGGGKSSSKWDPWTEWLTCSASCGDRGVQKRQRKCRSPDSGCVGKAQEVRACEPPPPKCVEYSAWSDWSACAAKCGGREAGSRNRTRTCLAGNCPPTDLIETEECRNTTSCPQPAWQEWGEWTTCSATCGGGQRQRHRVCRVPEGGGGDEQFGCDGESTTIAACNEKLCSATDGEGRQQTASEGAPKAEAKAWGEWMPCSVSCGIGFQLRERQCEGAPDGRRRPCPQYGKQARTCNVQDCSRVSSGGVLSEWSMWSACSRTCGQGFQYRHRECQNAICSTAEPLSEHRRCVLGPCPTWAAWESWSSACASCSPFETRHRRRQCVVKVAVGGGGDGVGEANEQQENVLPADSCNGAPVQHETCEHCGVERPPLLLGAPIVPVRIFAGSGIGGDSPEAGGGGIAGAAGNYLPWSEWQPCSATCGEGVRQRRRICAEGRDCSTSGAGVEAEACQAERSCGKSDYWSDWSSWSACTHTCGGGREIRTRKCQVALIFLCDGYARDERACATQPCGGGGQSIIYEAAVQALRSFNGNVKIPEWSEWSDFSACSCFTLTQFRRRYCRIVDLALQGFCSGAVIEQRRCEPTSCVSIAGGWSEWSEWSQCSRECGENGHQIRNRMCSNPLPSNRGAYCVGYSFDQRPCQRRPPPVCGSAPLDGDWSSWSEWSLCSGPCRNGQRSRTRYCSNPRPANDGQQCIGSDFELQSCDEPALCDHDTLASNRSSQNTTNNGTVAVNGTTTSAIVTPEVTGARFGAWSAWSACGDDACGFAYQWRQRICERPPCRDGIAYMTSICWTDAACPQAVNGRWASWSAWTESNCGSPCANVSGIRTRTRSCTNPGPRNNGMPCFGPAVDASTCPHRSASNTTVEDVRSPTLFPSPPSLSSPALPVVCSVIGNIELTEHSINSSSLF